MSEILRKFGLFFLLCTLFVSVVSCTNNNTTESTLPSAITISIDDDNLENRLAITDFDITDLFVTVYFADSTTITVPVNDSMISASDLAKLSTPGIHNITITYLGQTTSFTVELVENDVTLQLMSIYDLGVSTGAITCTYEEWIASIRGEDGADGREIALRSAEGFIQWQYLGETSWTNLISVSNLVGVSGTNGREVTFQIAEGFLQWQYVGDTSWTPILTLSELTGNDGITPTISISDDGYWVINGLKTAFLAVPTTPIVTTVDFVFDLNGGTMDAIIASQYLDIVKGDSVTLPIPEKYGYVFAGWYTGDTINDGQFLNTSVVIKDLTLHARWEIDFSPIELLLSTIISGTNYVINFDQIENYTDGSVFSEKSVITTSSDASGWIHQNRTTLSFAGEDQIETEVFSSVVIDNYEYFYLSTDSSEDEKTQIGRSLADNADRNMSLDVPRVDSPFEYFQIDDFVLREGEYTFDYVPSNDGLLAFAYALSGDDFDNDNLSAVFFGDLALLEITIPIWDETYESYEYTLVLTFHVQNTGTVSTQFLLEEYKTVMLQNLQTLVDYRIDKMVPTIETETSLLALLHESQIAIATLENPKTLWDTFTTSQEQLMQFVLVTDVLQVAINTAKTQFLIQFNALSLTATDESIISMQSLLDTAYADMDLGETIDQITNIITQVTEALNLCYIADEIKIEYYETKDIVMGYLEETAVFYQSIIEGEDSNTTLDALLNATYTSIQSVYTASEVYAIWDEFANSLQTSNFAFIVDYETELSVLYQSIRNDYLFMTKALWEENSLYSSSFDDIVCPELNTLSFAPVHEFMYKYINIRELMEREYTTAWREIINQKMAEIDWIINFLTAEDEQIIYLNTMSSFYDAIDLAITSDDLLIEWIDFQVAYSSVTFSQFTSQKHDYFVFLQDHFKTLLPTANADSIVAMTEVMNTYATFLSTEATSSDEVTNEYWVALNALNSAYFYDYDTVLLTEAKNDALFYLESIQNLYGMATNYGDYEYENDINEAIHQVNLAINVTEIDLVITNSINALHESSVNMSLEVASEINNSLEWKYACLETENIEIPATFITAYLEYTTSLSNLGDLSDAILSYVALYTSMEDMLWNANYDKRVITLDGWYEEKSAIVEESFLSEVDYLYDRTREFIGISRDAALWNIMTNNFQIFLIDCPTDPIRLDRWQVLEIYRDEVDNYAQIVTDDSLLLMEGLCTEFASLISTYTERTAMDLKLSEYLPKLSEVYVEDLAKAEFLNQKDIFYIYLDVFGEMMSQTIINEDNAYSTLLELYYEALDDVMTLEYSQDTSTIIQGYISNLLSQYALCETANWMDFIQYLEDRIEDDLYYILVVDSVYLQEVITDLDNLHTNAQLQLIAATTPEMTILVYVNFIEDIKSLTMEGHRAWILAQMLSIQEDTYARLPEDTSNAFITAYLEDKAIMEGLIREASLDLVYNQFITLVNNQIHDPLLDARRDAIEAIQEWLTINYPMATDASRTDLYATQSDAYDALYAATTVEAIDTERTNALTALETALIEDPARTALYEYQITQATEAIQQYVANISYYTDSIRGLNQVLIIAHNAYVTFASVTTYADLESALNATYTSIEAVSLTWSPTLLEEGRNLYTSLMYDFMVSWSEAPEAVQTAYIEAYNQINEATNPLLILEYYQNFMALAQTYL